MPCAWDMQRYPGVTHFSAAVLASCSRGLATQSHFTVNSQWASEQPAALHRRIHVCYIYMTSALLYVLIFKDVISHSLLIRIIILMTQLNRGAHGYNCNWLVPNGGVELTVFIQQVKKDVASARPLASPRLRTDIYPMWPRQSKKFHKTPSFTFNYI